MPVAIVTSLILRLIRRIAGLVGTALMSGRRLRRSLRLGGSRLRLSGWRRFFSARKIILTGRCIDKKNDCASERRPKNGQSEKSVHRPPLMYAVEKINPPRHLLWRLFPENASDLVFSLLRYFERFFQFGHAAFELFDSLKKLFDRGPVVGIRGRSRVRRKLPRRRQA
jgi:hypothetical protein